MEKAQRALPDMVKIRFHPGWNDDGYLLVDIGTSTVVT